MAPWQSRPSWGMLAAVFAAGLSGAAAWVAARLWLPFGGGRRRRLPQGAKQPSEGEAQDLDPEEVQAEFEAATAWASAASNLSTAVKLAIYGCFKQATVGDCPPQRPWGMEASMKWEAWREHQGASKAEAMRRYVQALDEAVPSWRSGSTSPPAAARGDGPKQGDGVSTGPSVSVMQASIGDPSQAGEVDATPVGQLCEMIAENELGEAFAMLERAPALAFQADKDGMTPLHWACDRGRLEVVRALLDRLSSSPQPSALVNARDGSGDTPLHYAVLTDNTEIAQLLLDAGADPEVENNDGESPLALADGEEWRKLLKRGA